MSGNLDLLRSFVDALGEILYETCGKYSKLTFEHVSDMIEKIVIKDKSVIGEIFRQFKIDGNSDKNVHYLIELFNKQHVLPYFDPNYVINNNNNNNRRSGDRSVRQLERRVSGPEARTATISDYRDMISENENKHQESSMHSSMHRSMTITNAEENDLISQGKDLMIYQLYGLAICKYIGSIVSKSSNEHLPKQYDFVFINDNCQMTCDIGNEFLKPFDKLFPYHEETYDCSQIKPSIKSGIPKNMNNMNDDVKSAEIKTEKKNSNVNEICDKFESMYTKLIHDKWMSYLDSDNIRMELNDSHGRCVFVIDRRRKTRPGNDDDDDDMNSEMKLNENNDYDTIYVFFPRCPIELGNMQFKKKDLTYENIERIYQYEVNSKQQNNNNSNNNNSNINNINVINVNSNQRSLYFCSEIKKGYYISETMLTQTLKCVIPSLLVNSEMNENKESTVEYNHVNCLRNSNSNIQSENMFVFSWQLHESMSDTPLAKAYTISNRHYKRFFVKDMTSFWAKILVKHRSNDYLNVE